MHGRLVVFGGGEGFRTLGRNGGVAFDELGHHATLGFDAEGQRGDVEQQHVLDLAAQHTGLQGSTYCHHLVGVHALVGLAATGEFLHHVRDGRHTGGAAHQHHVVNVGDGNASVLDHLVERCLGAVQEVLGDALELGPGEVFVQEQRVLVGVDGDVGQVNVGGLGGGQFDLGLLCGLAQPLHGHLVLGQVHAGGCLELFDQPVDDALIPVVAAEFIVAGGGANFHHTVADFQQGHVEGAATEVENENGLFLLALLQAIGQGCRGGLVHDAQHVQASNGAGFLGGLPLGVREVGGNGNNGVGDFFTKVRFGIALELHERPGGNFLRRVLLAVNVNAPVGADVPLHGADGAVHVGDRLVLGRLANNNFTVLSEGHDGRGGPRPLRVSDNGSVATFQSGNDRVCGAEVNAYCASHMKNSS